MCPQALKRDHSTVVGSEKGLFNSVMRACRVADVIDLRLQAAGALANLSQPIYNQVRSHVSSAVVCWVGCSQESLTYGDLHDATLVSTGRDGEAWCHWCRCHAGRNAERGGAARRGAVPSKPGLQLGQSCNGGLCTLRGTHKHELTRPYLGAHGSDPSA